MGAALGLWAAAVAVYYASRHPTVRLGGQLALMWAMILYPSTALNAAALLACTPVALSPQVRRSWEGRQERRGCRCCRCRWARQVYVAHCISGHFLTMGVGKDEAPPPLLPPHRLS